jgi:hypothetical protein
VNSQAAEAVGRWLLIVTAFVAVDDRPISREIGYVCEDSPCCDFGSIIDYVHRSTGA